MTTPTILRAFLRPTSTAVVLTLLALPGIAQCDPPPVTPPSGPVSRPVTPGSSGTPTEPAPAFAPEVDGGSMDGSSGPTTGGALDALDELARLSQGGLDLGLDLSRDGFANWEMWWDLNHLELIGIDARGTLRPVTGTADFFLGEGESSASSPLAVDSVAVADESWFRSRWIPQLLQLLEADAVPLLEGELLVAAGRVHPYGTADQRERLDEALARGLGSSSLDVQRSAVLACGLTGAPSWAPTLASLLHDDSSGRRLIGGGSVATELRADAAFALGDLGLRCEREDVRRYVVHSLDMAIEGDDGRREDMAVAAVLALSVVPLERVGVRDPGGRPEPASASRLATLRRLLQVFQEAKDSRLRVHVPAALGRVLAGLPHDEFDAARGQVIEALLKGLDSRRSERAELSSAIATCLGLAGRPTESALDGSVLDALDALARDARAGTRHAALLALGRIAGAPGSLACSIDVGERLTRSARRGDIHEKGWSLLALGLAGRDLGARGVALPEEWSATLLDAVDDSRQTSVFSAAALACGIVELAEASRPVLEGFERLPFDASRTRVAMALGMLRVHDATPLLDAWSETRTTDPAAAYGAALARELMGDAPALSALLSSDPSEVSSSAAAAAARALGEIDTPAARDALLAWVADSDRAALTRAAAVRALGRIAAPATSSASLLAGVVCFEAAPSTLLDGRGRGALERLDL
ncbi:hypothetical protein Pla163_21040 [Planctomycetes bacterium Pla163]|uniref:HEAT repeat protein n=1 Tax=Rohdeia mirabilis TaxID=2528008 RepID=A0A518D0J4_9BACT|nr:hypothetical protein Pla163_21040 [Planctomycetes bacterium Pla163]